MSDMEMVHPRGRVNVPSTFHGTALISRGVNLHWPHDASQCMASSVIYYSFTWLLFHNCGSAQSTSSLCLSLFVSVSRVLMLCVLLCQLISDLSFCSSF